jgi:hypothetical protein
MEEHVIGLLETAVVVLGIVALIVRKNVKLESLVSDAKRIACARMVVHAIQWMEHVIVLGTGLANIVINLVRMIGNTGLESHVNPVHVYKAIH